MARATFDLDILIEAAPKNAERVLRAVEAGMDVAGLVTLAGLVEHEITILRDRFKIDVQTRTPGLRFATAWKNRDVVTFRGQKIILASRRDVIRSKRAAGRFKDMQDVEALLAPADDSVPPGARALEE